jgi:hemoglobin-like flavoprotein
MTPEVKKLVQESWAKVEPVSAVAAALFYGRLFELAPSLRPMFRGSMQEQEKKLMQTLTVVVRGLDRPDQLVSQVQALGRRHAGYGVADAHYGTVAQALLWTLEQALGDAFTPQVRDGWVQAYTLLAGVMQSAAGECREVCRAA